MASTALRLVIIAARAGEPQRGELTKTRFLSPKGAI